MTSSALRAPEVQSRLPGWTLFWAFLELADVEAAAGVLDGLGEATRQRFESQPLAQHPTAMGVRRLFRQAGCDPTRYRPSSEALIRRLLKGDDLPTIHPLVDLNNLLSVRLVVPVCILAEGTVESPMELRAGEEQETFDSLRGPFKLVGKPLLADQEGPFGTPITDRQRVKVQAHTRRAWLVAYLPEGTVDAELASRTLDAILEEAPGAFQRLF